MIIARIIKPDTGIYKTISGHSEKMDGLMKLKPFTWFAVWIMMTSGTSAQQQTIDRFSYWDMSLALTGIITMVIVAGIITYIFKNDKFNFTNSSINFFWILNHSVVALILFITGWGWLNLIQGDLLLSIKTFIPYLCTYLSVLLVFQIKLDDIPEKGYVPGKSMIAISLVLSLLGVVIGIQLSDPVVSTMSAVIAPFYIVALVFPDHKRHIERCRIYPIFIGIFFISVRLPWVLIPSFVLFFILRTYHYFRYNIVYPTFAVDHD